MSNKDVVECLLGNLELCPGYVIVFPSPSPSSVFLGWVFVVGLVFLIVALMIVKWI